MIDILLGVILVLIQILNAGNAVTAFSLLLYALTFNPRERVARILALLLAAVTLIYFSDVLASTASQDPERLLWLRLQWLGVCFIPAIYMHFSDALLAATGRPSRGRRSSLVQVAYVLATASFAAVGLGDWLVTGNLRTAGQTAYLAPGDLFPLFLLYFSLAIAFTGLNLWRSYQRCLTRVSRRRMRYLMFGSLAPLLAGFPFMTAFGPILLRLPLLSWTVLASTNALVAVQMVMMSYAVAYFGVSFPDRVVKSRLFQWILRGPVVASSALAVTVVVNRISLTLGLEDSRSVPFAMVAVILLLQYLITLVRPSIERWMFYGQDRMDVSRLQKLEQRLLTTGDLRQYLESILNAACDLVGSPSAFVAVVGKEGIELEIAVGPDDPLRGSEDLPPLLVPEDKRNIEGLGSVFRWDHYWLIPLRANEESEILGMLGVRSGEEDWDLDEETTGSLRLLTERASLGLTDRQLQREVFSAVDRLVPEIESLQQIRAAASYGGGDLLSDALDRLSFEENFVQLVRQALGHYWGGPRLTNSPLLGLQVVRSTVEEHDGNAVNALRSILRRAIDRTRPEGSRRLTAEWMLFNILDMKFLEGRKVRDVALRLAMSEADFYRKQKVAIESVARAMADMEREAVMAGKD